MRRLAAVARVGDQEARALLIWNLHCGGIVGAGDEVGDSVGAAVCVQGARGRGGFEVNGGAGAGAAVGVGVRGGGRSGGGGGGGDFGGCGGCGGRGGAGGGGGEGGARDGDGGAVHVEFLLAVVPGPVVVQWFG